METRTKDNHIMAIRVTLHCYSIKLLLCYLTIHESATVVRSDELAQ